jgi:hypothetical protein
MPFTSLLYVSNSLLAPPRQPAEVESIVAAAVERNAALGVTGALIFTGVHFAQLLEGSKEAVDELMASIIADERHRDVEVVKVVNRRERRFPGWSLAYAGPSEYVDRHVRPLLEDSAKPGARARAASALVRLMLEFTTAGGVDQLHG